MSIKAAYYNPRFSGSFAGAKSFMRERKYTNHAKVMKTLYKLKPYTLHRPFRRRFKRRKFMVMFRKYQYQIDLIDFTKYKNENNGYKYILTCIDVFSKYAAVAFMKNKTTTEAIKAMKKIIRQMGSKPEVCYSDQGGEFKSRAFEAYLKSIGVKLWFAYGDNKAGVIERFHRSILARLGRYWTHVGNRKYVKALPMLVKSYNATVHSTTKLRPKDVTDENEHIVFNNTFKKLLSVKSVKPEFKVGDTVLVSLIRTNKYVKGYEETFKDEIFTIYKVNKTNPPTYVLSDREGQVIRGNFAGPELTHYYGH